ncbi:hypothetical protein E1B28_003898 [Marasmius oreades]|uniref:Uncharacterized protein n=1 Tax=Marasmius oreades TaxID=181124 RepID=A0A9P8ACG0_9AGAR|nr:uncharacterized protein E1B28_003898 [Marasmius oreades]KAG7096465.1 hypothetical protein E1B28_003898 [Marasmius oreades]
MTAAVQSGDRAPEVLALGEDGNRNVTRCIHSFGESPSEASGWESKGFVVHTRLEGSETAAKSQKKLSALNF